MAEIVRGTFDGISVSFYDANNNVVAHTMAVSGKAGNQSPSLQEVRNTGPLPEGTYTINVADIDYRDNIVERFTWSSGWGNARVTLNPSDETELFGRSGFFLHGSTNGYGSAGCIDIGLDDTRFIGILEQYGAQRITFVVDYSLTREYLENNPHPLLRDIDQCFLAGTQISMWDGTKKPIEQVESGDIVVSYDKDGNLKPGRVKRTMTNRAKQILDVHGLMVTPGHATLCGDGRFNGQHVPILDILRSDGALVQEDGTKIRAATGCPLGTMGDRMITAIIDEQQPDGLVRIAEVGRIRAGTRFIKADGEDVSILDMILKSGGRLTEDGMIQTSTNGPKMPFHWTLTSSLPKPEDYVLQRSATYLQDIYQANEWESVRPSMPIPLGGEAGATLSRHRAIVAAQGPCATGLIRRK
jgi:Protein of unknown function (DUF2778)